MKNKMGICFSSNEDYKKIKDEDNKINYNQDTIIYCCPYECTICCPYECDRKCGLCHTWSLCDCLSNICSLCDCNCHHCDCDCHHCDCDC